MKKKYAIIGISTFLLSLGTFLYLNVGGQYSLILNNGIELQIDHNGEWLDSDNLPSGFYLQDPKKEGVIPITCRINLISNESPIFPGETLSVHDSQVSPRCPVEVLEFDAIEEVYKTRGYVSCTLKDTYYHNGEATRKQDRGCLVGYIDQSLVVENREVSYQKYIVRPSPFTLLGREKYSLVKASPYNFDCSVTYEGDLSLGEVGVSLFEDHEIITNYLGCKR